MNLRYTASDFNSSLDGTDDLEFDWIDLIWATLTVGKSPQHPLVPHGIHSMLDSLSRVAQLRSTLRHTRSTCASGTRRLEKTQVYESMDPTEKGVQNT